MKLPKGRSRRQNLIFRKADFSGLGLRSNLSQPGRSDPLEGMKEKEHNEDSERESRGCLKYVHSSRREGG